MLIPELDTPGSDYWMQASGAEQGFGHQWPAFRLLPPPSARLPMVGSVLGHWLQIRLGGA